MVNYISFSKTPKIRVKVDTSLQPVSKLSSYVHSAFNSYFKRCKQYDEFIPKRKACRNTGGFHASLLESIESLYLLNLKEDYETALKFITNNFNCSKLQWVNRHEFWSRGVGSLIGAYTVTGDKIFLKHAEECAGLMLSVDEQDSQNSYPFVNLQTQEFKKRSWQEGNAVSDITAGLPELAALYIITKKEIYNDAVEAIYARIPIQESKLAQFYTEGGSVSSSSDVIDGYITSFIFNTVTGVLLKDNSEVLPFIQEVIANLPSQLGKEPVLSYPLFDVSHYLEICDVASVISTEDDLFEHLQKEFSRPFFPNFAFDEKLNTYGFNFEGAGLRAIARETSNDVKGITSLLKIVNEALSRTKVGSGFSGIRKTSHHKGHTSVNNLQSSNLFGQWVSVGALAASGNLRFLNSSVINERGHILLLSFPQQPTN